VANAILEVKGATKTFPGVKALDDVHFTLERGGVHALVGENGAGKSTLMLTLGDVYKPDSGQILLEGRPVDFDSAHDANRAGISVVYQELSRVPNLSVAENIFAHRQPTRSLNLIHWDKPHRDTRELLKRFGSEHIEPRTPVAQLSMARRRVVEILNAMSVGSILGFTAIIAAMIMKAGVPVPLAVLSGLLVGVAIGLWNGMVVAKLKINPFVTTLASLSIFRGLTFALTSGRNIAELPKAIKAIGQTRIAGVQLPIIYALVLVLFGDIVMRNSRFFRQNYYIGGNEKAARLSGINVDCMTIFNYVLAGVLASFAGIVFTTRMGDFLPGRHRLGIGRAHGGHPGRRLPARRLRQRVRLLPGGAPDGPHLHLPHPAERGRVLAAVRGRGGAQHGSSDRYAGLGLLGWRPGEKANYRGKSSMKPFDCYNPTRIIFGAGTFSRLGQEAAKFGKKALPVKAEGPLEKTGVYAKAAKSVRQGIKLCKEQGLEIVVADCKWIEQPKRPAGAGAVRQRAGGASFDRFTTRKGTADVSVRAIAG